MKTNTYFKKQSSGFALVVTILLMVLLAIIAVGTLSLSTVTIRSKNHDSALNVARANARMALMIAIGELQKTTGADTRVTAPADTVLADAPPLTGVWRSWEGENHDSTGRPIKPDYDSKTRPNGSGGRFITWLVSGADEGGEMLSPSPTQLVYTSGGDNRIPLLASGTLGTRPGQVHVDPQLIQDNTGAYAWWVSPENQKARLLSPHKPTSDSLAGWADRAKSYSVPDPEPFGLNVILDDPEDYVANPNQPKAARKAITLRTTELITDDNPQNPHQSFHDLSTNSVGLLTNTATGGWRKDLSIFSERWSNLPASGLALFRLSPLADAVTSVNKPTTTNPTIQKSIFYPWSEYNTASSSVTLNQANPYPSYYMQRHGAVSSWHSLVDYMTSYKTVTYDTSSGVGSVPLTWARTNRVTPWGPTNGNYSNQDLFRFLHNQQKAPVLARIQWVFKVRSRRQNPTNPSTTFNIDLLVTPVYTLWNPYNVAITINQNYGVSMNKTMPVAIAIARGVETLDYNSAPNLATMFRRYTVGSISDMEGINHGYDSSIPNNYANAWEQSNGQAAGFPVSMTLAPGEVRQFSLAANTAVGNTGVMGVLKEGYDGANAFGFASFNATTGAWNARRTGFLTTDTLKFGMRFDNLTRIGGDPNETGPGIQLQFGRWAGPDPANPTSAGNNRYLGDGYANYTMLTNLEFSKQYWNEPVNLPVYPVLSIEDNGVNPPWTPVFSIIWGPRVSMGTAAGNPANRPTKGLLQNNPFSGGVLTTSDPLPTNHPANLPFDFQYVGHQQNSDTLPEEGTNGFIVSGNQIGNGLSRLIVGEIPMRPLASLFELQGWDLRARNPLPPFQYNIIGNSDAIPMIPKDAVVFDPNSNAVTNRQHDDAFCANHLLFDDWFLSSIAPEPQTFGQTIARDINTVYRDYLKGDRGLVNRAYRPIAEDIKLTDADATTRIGQIITSNDGWQKVASRFEVDGMFNINSTSVNAWRAMLGHARKQQIAYHTENGIELDSTEQDYVVSRNTIATDVKAGSNESMAGNFPNASEYSGFRALTDAQLDLLAERIVEQVRARGPFLSLSEFVNRRLDTNEDLALAGAVQTALNTLSADIHPRLMDPDYASATMAPTDDKMDGADYQFNKAAEGYSTYGLPGWIRQADLLRPIAPVLSARDDTFTIRAYGDARDANGKIIAKAWCEAVVTRGRAFVDETDAADSINPPTLTINQRHGRRYNISSFRWLTEDEV